MENIINKYDLFIFDLDDTLVKTEHIHYEAWLITLKKFVNEDFFIENDFFFSKFHSLEQNSIINYLSLELKLNNVSEVINYKNSLYLDLLRKNINEIEMIDGIEILLNLIVNNNKKFVIVSNSPKNNIDFFLEKFPILKNSSKNYYRELFNFKKPNPECYLMVLKDFPNEKKIGFEDSITGIEALTQVNEIFPVFINNQNYIHYNFIINNYKNIDTIKNYYELLRNS